MIRREFPHVADPYRIEVALVWSWNVVTSLPKDSSLLDLGPSNMVLEPMALLKVADQVYKTVLCKEVRHLLALRAPHLVKFHGQVPKDDCGTLQGEEPVDTAF